MVDALQRLLEDARRGNIRALAVVVKTGPDRHHALMAGEYREHPEQAMQGVFQMERHLRIDM